jgi:hypothetical protein
MFDRLRQGSSWRVAILIVGIALLLTKSPMIKALFAENQSNLLLARRWSDVCLKQTIQGEQRIQLFSSLQVSDHSNWWQADVNDVWFFPAFSMAPIVVVTDRRRLEAENPTWGGLTGYNESGGGGSYLVVFSGGGPRIPFLLDETSQVAVSVRAKHDDPPPVTFAVTLGDSFTGQFLFERGDDTWGTETLTTTLSGGCHWLHIFFIHDFYDEERQLDRNGYIDWIEIKRQ